MQALNFKILRNFEIQLSKIRFRIYDIFQCYFEYLIAKL
ncbi:hypothetical protein CAMGR0001_2321 [Campylobacter gracilis RM3268]|uniref:Uncharacterized protein n=1 Tax=Campylobacter gracilis RM3268 TaxID=553220 RepID=C8PDX2_9BACT|nr:hypothetical protein CAMGR0001_2321 [Campylobacter gracilis RM3268]